MVSFKAFRQGLQLIWVSLSKRMVAEPLDPYLHVHQQITYYQQCSTRKNT